MKAIIFLVSRSRFVVPRVGNFLYAEDLAAATYPHQPFVFEGRALDMTEFNEAAARLLDVRNAHLGYEVSVRIVDDVPAEKPAPAPKAPAAKKTATKTAKKPAKPAPEPAGVDDLTIDEGKPPSGDDPAPAPKAPNRPVAETEID